MPAPSVTTVRVAPWIAGLVASTVTPGSTPPDASRTVPVNVPCANARDGSSHRAAASTQHFTLPRILVSPLIWIRCPGTHLAPPAGPQMVADARQSDNPCQSGGTAAKDSRFGEETPKAGAPTPKES